MFRKIIFVTFFMFFLCKSMLSAPISTEEHAEELNIRLSYYMKRLNPILKDIKPAFSADMRKLLDTFERIRAQPDIKAKELLLEDFSKELNNDFYNYLQQQLDEQYLHGEIVIEEYYLRQLLPQVDAALATEISNLLPKYQQALQTAQFDERYEFFTSIAEKFSPQLTNLLENKPEDAKVLNVHLQFFREFMVVMLANCQGCEYEEQLKQLAVSVEQGLKETTAEQKLLVLDKFDDLDTKFGRYVNNRIIEYEFERFSL